MWVCNWGPHKFLGILLMLRVSEVWKNKLYYCDSSFNQVSWVLCPRSWVEFEILVLKLAIIHIHILSSHVPISDSTVSFTPAPTPCSRSSLSHTHRFMGFFLQPPPDKDVKILGDVWSIFVLTNYSTARDRSHLQSVLHFQPCFVRFRYRISRRDDPGEQTTQSDVRTMGVWVQHEEGEGLLLATSREKDGHGNASRQSWSR